MRIAATRFIESHGRLQRTLYIAQQQLEPDRLSRQVNLVALYKVLGGGWEAS